MSGGEGSTRRSGRGAREGGRRPLARLLSSAALCLAALLPQFPAGLRADTVFFNDGGRVRGRIVREGPEGVTVETPFGEVEVPAGRIARILREPTLLDELDRRRAELAAGDVESLFLLGRWCRENGLYKQGADLLKAVLARQPNHAGARAQLGYRWLNGAWQRPAGNRPLFPSPRPAATRPAGSPRPNPTRQPTLPAGLIGEIGVSPLPVPGLTQALPLALESEHYRLLTGLGRPQGERLLAILEDLRLVYFRELGVENPGPPACRDGKLEVLFFRSQEDFDRFSMAGEPPPSPVGFFNPMTNRVYAHSAVQTLCHEAAHQLGANHLGSLLGYFDRRTGQYAHRSFLPHYWVEEGLGSYFENFRPGAQPGQGAVGQPTRLFQAAWALQRGAWLPLERFVAFDYLGFMRANALELSDRYAEAQLWTSFFLHAENGRWRPAFLAYVREIMSHRARADSFTRNFGAAPASFNQAVLDYLRGFGGRPGQPQLRAPAAAWRFAPAAGRAA